jgi:hypothetical protein
MKTIWLEVRRRTILLLIVAPAIVWNVLGGR